MALSYAFDPSAGETPDTVARRRQTADALAARIFGNAPKNLGEGLSAIGQALIARQMANEADAAQKTGMASIPAWAGGSANPSAAVASAITGQAPPASPTAAPASGDAASAIAGIESGGKYDLLGPVTKTGDRAYGKYQIMGANIPEWTKTHLGQAMTPDQFLASPEAQDAVFKGQFGQYAQKYGPEGAAKAWFAGEKGMNNPNARDQLGTTVQAYADRFSKAYGGAPYQVAGSSTAAPSAAPAAPADASSDAALPTNAQPAQASLPTAQAVQPRSQSYGGPFPNVSTADLTKQALNPWVPAATRQVLGAEVTRRATMDQQASDPVRALDIKQKQTALTPLGQPYKDEDGNLVQKDALGKVTVLKGADSTEPSIKRYNFYVDQENSAGRKPLSYNDWELNQGRAKAATTTVNNTVNPILKGVGDRFNEDMDVARTSVDQIKGIYEARRALDQGSFTGLGADARLFGSKVASLFGVPSEQAVNTETLRSAVGNSVLAKAKALGANPSNADRDYIEKVQGGSIKLEEGSMRRLLEMQERWARQAIQRANGNGQKILSAQPEELKNIAPLLSVQEPGSYDDFLKANPIQSAPPAAARPAAPQPGEIRDGYRFKGGNPADPNNWAEVS